MKNYSPPQKTHWKGRESGQKLYFHERIQLIDLLNDSLKDKKGFAILGYACDEGVRRNKGRVGAKHGPDSIRHWLGKKACHLDSALNIYDAGNITCINGQLEITQSNTTQTISSLLANDLFPIVLGGGHDLAYAHFMGLANHLDPTEKGEIGIINLDAHFDLRIDNDGPNSGTPFYQIARYCQDHDQNLNYLCLGIQQDSNDANLFNTAYSMGVESLTLEYFKMSHWTKIEMTLLSFIDKVDHIYLTIDLDGFSSAYAPGVSAPSPFGFDPDLALKCIETIGQSGKLLSTDLVELNPKYDIGEPTARLAAGLAIKIMNVLTN